MEILIFSFSEEKQPLRHHEGESSSKYSRQYKFREKLHLSPFPLYLFIKKPILFKCPWFYLENVMVSNRSRYINYLYSCTVHFEDSLIIIHQQTHQSYIIY
jgi:hypothetical protein